MEKKIKLGLSAVAALALMFAATAGVVAQKNGSSSKDKIEVTSKESATVVSESNFRESMLSPVDFTIATGAPITDPGNWEQSDLNDCRGGANLCGITFDQAMYPLANGKPDDSVLGIVNSEWSSTPHNGQIGSTGIYVHRKN